MPDELAADTGGALRGIDDEVVDFQIKAAPDLGGDPGTGDTRKFSRDEGADELVVGMIR